MKIIASANAVYTGRCPLCHEPVEFGELIALVDDPKVWVHGRCVVAHSRRTILAEIEAKRQAKAFARAG